MRGDFRIVSNQKKNRRRGILAPVVLLVLLVLLAGGSLARYFTSRDAEGAVRTKRFYFTSDFLDGTVHTMNPGIQEVTFTVGNHADELRFSEMMVNYTCTVKKGGTSETVFVASGELPGNGISDDSVTFSLTALGLPFGTYDIEVSASGGGVDGIPNSGYRKTLAASVVFSEEQVLYKYLENMGTHVVLTVWAKGFRGDVAIRYPDGLVPDNTDPVMQAALEAPLGGTATFTDKTTGSVEGSFTAGSYASHKYRFFVTGAAPTIHSFTVTGTPAGGGETVTANEKAPG